MSAVFVTFDRLQTLVPTVESFRRNTEAREVELETLVSDDASPEEVRRRMTELPVDRVVSAERNGGIGANQNQASRIAGGDLVLMIQDDWICEGPPDYLDYAARLMRARPDLGLIILNEHPSDLPVRELWPFEGRMVRIYDHDPGKVIETVGENPYTDWPHLKRRDFHEVVGSYREGVRMERCELDMAQKFNRQTRYRIADVVDLNVFRHIGEELSYRKPTLTDKVNRVLNGTPGIGPVWKAAKRRAKALARRLRPG